MNYLLIIIIKIFVDFSYASNISNLDNILVIVNDEIILKSDLDFLEKLNLLENNYLKKINRFKLRNILINKIIIDKILYKIFNGDSILINENDIENYIKKKSNNFFLNKKEFIEYIKFNNININQYLNYIKEKIIIKKIIKNNIKKNISINNDELKKFYSEIKKNDLFNKLFLIYNFDLIKIYNKNKISDDFISKLNKKIEFIINNNNIKEFKNIKISNNYLIDKIKIKKINNIFYKDLQFNYLFDKKNKNINNLIGPIYLSNIILYIKINFIKEISDKNYIIDEANINYIFNKELNNNKNIKTNYKNILNVYKNLIKSKNINILNNNIKNINLGWMKLDCYNNFFKKKILSLEKNKISKPFKYNNRWNLIYINNIKKIKYKNYIENLFINEFILNSKSFFFVKKIIVDNINNIYINFLDNNYNLKI